jgi:hypothetical protein
MAKIVRSPISELLWVSFFRQPLMRRERGCNIGNYLSDQAKMYRQLRDKEKEDKQESLTYRKKDTVVDSGIYNSEIK